MGWIGMTFWLHILAYVLVWLTGQSLNTWQVGKYGFMPMTFPWSDWIPIAQRWVFSIGDVLQLIGVVAIILATFVRFCDERYKRA
jgi:hypothetical protein